jgi:hypothetical protein
VRLAGSAPLTGSAGFLSGKHDPADFALRLLHKAVGLGREVGVPMRLSDMAFEELTEAMNHGWEHATAPSASSCRSNAPASNRPPSIQARAGDPRPRQAKVI